MNFNFSRNFKFLLMGGGQIKFWALDAIAPAQSKFWKNSKKAI